MLDVTDAITRPAYPRRRRPDPVRPRSAVRAVVALIIGVIAGVVGAGTVAMQPPVYGSQAVVTIDQPKAVITAKDAGAIDKLSRLRDKYVGLVRTDVMLRPIAASAGVPLSVARQAISATEPPQMLLIVTTAQTGRADEAQRLAQAAAREMTVYAEQEQVSDRIPAAERFVLSVATDATPAVKVSPTVRHSLNVGLLAGIACGVLALALLDRRWLAALQR